MKPEEASIKAYETSILYEVWDKQLAQLAEENRDIYTVDAEALFMVENFRKAHPQRAIQVGIAEQNMIGVAAGIAAKGKIVFAHTMANFLTLRACEMVRNDIACNRFNAKIVSSYASVLGGPWGSTHHGLEDVAVMRTIPGMTIVVPADRAQVKQAARAAVKFEGPMYIRLESDVPIYHHESDFKVGSSIVLRDGTDITLMAYGAMVGRSLEAAHILSEKGVEARVVNMHTVKPIDKQAIIEAGRDTRGIVTVEEHSIIGGLGSAVAEFVAEEMSSTTIKRIGFEDTFSVLGKYEDILKHYRLHSPGDRQSLEFTNTLPPWKSAIW